MQFEPSRLPEVVLIEPTVFKDSRGYVFESWRRDRFDAAGIAGEFVQDNHSHSMRYTLRGLHYQIPRGQGKLVRVVSGVIFDVAVDLRRSSPRFGQWVGATLSEADHRMLWVPPGFAHGYLALSDVADVLYKCTEFYAPASERVIRWDDPQIDVQWPLPTGRAPILSDKDAAAPLLEDAESYS